MLVFFAQSFGAISRTRMLRCRLILVVLDDGNLHLQLNLPRCHPYVQPEIVSNPIIEQVAGAVLHGLVYIRYINGNTACRTTTGLRLRSNTLLNDPWYPLVAAVCGPVV